MSTEGSSLERTTVVHFDEKQEPIVTHDHDDDNDNEQNSIIDDLDVYKSPSKSTFKCKYCTVSLKKPDYLKHLEENCKEIKIISSNQLFKEISSSLPSQVHEVSSPPEFFCRFCTICGVNVKSSPVSKFYDPEDLERHLQSHLRPPGFGKQTYICTNYCQESFYSPTTLSIHLRFTHQVVVEPISLLLLNIFSKIPKLQLKKIDDKFSLVSTQVTRPIKSYQEKLVVYYQNKSSNNVVNVNGNCKMTMVMDNKDYTEVIEESFLVEKTHNNNNNNNINLSSKMVSSSNSSSAGGGDSVKKAKKKKICHRCRKVIVLNSSVKHVCKIDNESTQEPNYACKLCPNKYFYRDSARRHLRNNHEKEIAGVEKIGDYVILLPKSKKNDDDHHSSSSMKKKKSKNKSRGHMGQDIDNDNDEDHHVGDFQGQHLKVDNDEEPVVAISKSNQLESRDRIIIQNSFSPTPTLVMVQEVIEPQNHEREIDDQEEISTVQMPVAVVVEHYNSTPPSVGRHEQSISPEKYDSKSSSSKKKEDSNFISTPNTNFVICGICAEICLDRKDHTSHLKDAHEIDPNNFKNPSIPPSCPVCEKKMQHMYSLRRHLTCQHVGYIDDIVEKKMKEREKLPNTYASNSIHVVKEVTIQKSTHHQSPTVSSVPFNFECQICQVKFTKYESLEKHLKVHSNEKPGKDQNCPLCDKKLSKPKGVFNHLLKVHHKDAVKQANENNLSKEKQQQIQFHILNDETPSVVLASGCAPEMPLYPTSDFGPLEDFIPEDFLNSLNVNEPAGSTETFTSFQSEAEFGAAFDNFDNEYQPQQVEPTNLSPVKHQKITTVAVSNYSPNSTVVVEQQNPNSDIQIVYQNNNLPREFYGSPETTSTPPQQQQYNYPEQNYSPSTNVYSYNYTAGSISASGGQQVFFSPQPQQQVQIYSSNYSKQQSQSTVVNTNTNNKNSSSFSNLDYLATAAALSAPAPAEVSEPTSQNSRASSNTNFASSPPQMHLLSPSTSSNSSTSQTPGSYQHYLIIQPLPSGGSTSTNNQPQQQLMPLTNHFYSPQPYNPILKIPKVPGGNQNQQQQQQTIINYNPEPINYHMQINQQQQQQQQQPHQHQQHQQAGETLKIHVMSPTNNLQSNNKRKVSADDEQQQQLSPNKLARVQSGPNLDPDIFPVLCPFPDCGFRFKNNKQQRSHYKINHEGLRFKCTQEGCTNTDFKYKDGYIKHLKKSHSIELDKEAANKITPVPTIPNSVPIDTLVKNSSVKALGPPPPPPYQPPQYQQQQQQPQQQQQSQQIIQGNFKPIYQTTEVPFNPPIPPPKKSKKYLLDQANYNIDSSQQQQQQQPPPYNQNLQIQEILKSALEQPASIAKKSAPPKKFHKVDSISNVNNESNQQVDDNGDDFFDFLNSVPTIKAKKSQPPQQPRSSLSSSSDYVNNFKMDNKNESSRFGFVHSIKTSQSQPVYGGSSVSSKKKKNFEIEPVQQSGRKNKKLKKISDLDGHFPCDELVDGVKCTKICKQQRFLDQHKKMVHGPTMFPLGSLPKILPDTTEVKTS